MNFSQGKAIIIGLIVGLGLATTNDAQSAEATKQPLTEQNTARLYQHPIRNFQIIIPPNVEVLEEKNGDRLSIRSRKGFVINIQSGDHRDDYTIDTMYALLEQRYLGTGKPWSRKGDILNTVTGGIPSKEVIYYGRNTRSRVVIAQGQKTDFVFMFFAPDQSYQNLMMEFDLTMASFKPASDELTEAETKQPKVVQSARKSIWNRFYSPDYGFRINYPENWIVGNDQPDSISFSGKPDTAEYNTIIAMQNHRPNVLENNDTLVSQSLKQYMAAFKRSVPKYNVLPHQAFVYEKNNLTLQGLQAVVTYQYKGGNYKKWIVMLPRPEGEIVHIWSYTAPENQFDKVAPMAQKILQSLDIEMLQ